MPIKKYYKHYYNREAWLALGDTAYSGINRKVLLEMGIQKADLLCEYFIRSHQNPP